MTKVIEIKFFSQPQNGDGFSYVIKINGEIVSYTSGLNSVSKTYNTGGYPNIITTGTDLPATINATVTNLSAINNYTGISYEADAQSIFVTIEYEGTLSVESIGQQPGRIEVYPPGEVVFENDIYTSHLRKAYNNDIIKLSGSTGSAAYCDISMPGFQARLYPDPEGKCYFNFRPFITALINTRNFEDTLIPALSGGDASTFIYDASAGTYLNANVQFRIGRQNGGIDTASHNLAWFAGVEQPGQYHTFLRSGSYILSPFRKNTANHYYLKYWEGYPFDISIYYPDTVFYFKNETTLLSQEFNSPGKISRIIFSDGRTDETLETLLPLSQGYNSIRFMASETPSGNDKLITLEKIPYSCGVYLKWLNKYGGYSYWLFENTYTIDRSAKQLGELAKDNNNLEDTYTRAIQIGRESQDTVKVIAELLTEEERLIVEGLLESPKIYLFTGSPFSQNSARDWIEVTLKTTSARLKNARQPLTNFTFDLELPQRYTQTQ